MSRWTTKLVGVAVVVSAACSGVLGPSRQDGRPRAMAVAERTVRPVRSARAVVATRAARAVVATRAARAVVPTSVRAGASGPSDLFPFGDAPGYGSTGASSLSYPIVGMAATPGGYWEVASDGGVFAFGDAGFFGSTGAMRLNRPIVGMAATPSGDGYWMLASDGGIFAFGDAAFHGSAGAMSLPRPFVGIATTPSGDGYWMVASDGGIFAFGDAAFHGSLGQGDLADAGQVAVGIAATRAGAGYWIVATRLDPRRVPAPGASAAGSAAPAPSSGPMASVLYDSAATGNWEIYRRDLRTNVVTQLTRDGRYDSWWARPSPDGTRMVFVRTPAGVHDTDYAKTSVWAADIDGGNVHQIVANGQYGALLGHPDWSPDGTRLVMVAGVYGIAVTDPEGRIVHRVAYGIDPVWTPDGKRILYIACRSGVVSPPCSHDQWRVWIVNEDGSSAHLLVDVAGQANDPRMSPDGSKIAWETWGGGLVWNLWVADADGGNPHVMFSDGWGNSCPVWVSDHELVFYKTQPLVHAGFGLWKVRDDGTGLSWLSPGQAGNAEMPFPLA
ncbi:MAG: hypothetical protein U0V73_12370 [Acidimicrobiia bacterium]